MGQRRQISHKLRYINSLNVSTYWHNSKREMNSHFVLKQW